MSAEFESECKKLNPAQKSAVDQIDGPLLVIAGPGTGKTQLLSARVANIIKQTDTDPSGILCLTFTNKAATNMRQRLNQLIGPESRKVAVHTFHSFAAEIMNNYADYFWNGASLSVAPDAVQLEIIQSILAKLPLDSPLASRFADSFTQLDNVKEALKLAKEAGLTPEELRQIIKANIKYLDKIEVNLADILSAPLSFKKLGEFKDKIDRLPEQKTSSDLLMPLSTVIKDSLTLAIDQDEFTGKTKETGKWKARWVQTVEGRKLMQKERQRNEWWLALSDAYELYRDELHRRGYYDFSDMVLEVIGQLQKNPDMRADIQERYLYVLIDEFQDTNAAQLRLAHLVADHYSANNRPNLMVVGDDDQSIFAFNGAELNNVLSFKRSYPDAKLIVLTDNYRSSQPILDAAKTIIEQADDRLVNREPDIKKELVAKNAPKRVTKIQQVSYPTRQHQYSAVAERVKQLWQDGEDSVAVLARKHASLQQLAGILNKQKIPLRYERQANVLEHEAVRLVYEIAKLAVNIAEGNKPAVNLGLSEVLRLPMWQISARKLWQMAVDNYSQPDWLESLLSSEDKKLAIIGNWLSWLARTSQNQPVSKSLECIIGLSESEYLTSPFKSYYLDERPVTSNYLETLSAVEILRSLTTEFSSHNQASLTDFVRFIELHLGTARVIADESWFVSGKRAVNLLTIHKAKGLEFDHVFVLDTIESMWKPKAGQRKSPANLRLESYGEKYDDYVRLLYVAASRAKSTLIATNYFTDDKGEQILPTPLLSALPAKIVDKPTEAPIEVLESNLAWPELVNKDEKTVLSDRLDQYSLSVSGLIDFLNLAEAGPQDFKQRHLLHLPRARSARGSYGTAIHAALETAQRLVNTTKLNLGTVIDRFETALEDEHLPPNEFDQYFKKGEGLLTDLFAQHLLKLPKGSQAEQRLDNIMVGKARLKGKLDRVDLPRKSEVIITDYKTGKALSSFDTKDKTKAVKAWRNKLQLTFYCMLTRNSPRYGHANDISGQMIYVEAAKATQMVLTYKPSQDEIDNVTRLCQIVWQHIIALNFPDVSAYSQDIDGVKKFENDLLEGEI